MNYHVPLLVYAVPIRCSIHELQALHKVLTRHIGRYLQYEHKVSRQQIRELRDLIRIENYVFKLTNNMAINGKSEATARMKIDDWMLVWELPQYDIMEMRVLVGKVDQLLKSKDNFLQLSR